MDEGKEIKRKLTAAMIFFLLLIVASVVLLYFVSGKQSSLEGADSNLRLSAQSGFNCEFAEAQKLYPFCDGVLKVTNDRVAYLTSSGNEAYGFSLSCKNPACFIKGRYAIVADMGGYVFAVCDSEKMIYSNPVKEKIKGAALSDDCFAALILDCSEAYGQILLYDPSGNFIADWVSHDSGFPVACAFADNSSRLAVTTLNTNGAVLKPFIKLLEIGKDRDKFSASDLAVFTPEESGILSSVIYSGEQFVAFGSDSAFGIKDGSLYALELKFSSINYVFSVDNHLFIIYSDGVGQVNKLAIIDKDNTKIYDSTLGSDVNAFGVEGNKCVISVDRRIFVYGSNGNVISDIAVDEDVIRVGFVGSDKIIVVSTGGVHTYNY